MSTRVLLADDHEIMREGLCALLHKHSDIEVVGQASDGRVAVEMAAELSPDVVIIDISMPNLNGIEATRKIIAACPNAKVMALSTHSSRSMVVKMLRAGALGYMLKESAFAELIDGIKAINQGNRYLCAKISDVVLADYMQMIFDIKREIKDVLTPRECEVLQMVAEGGTTKKIAEQLNLSVKTVNSHREHIMDKLRIHNVAELTKYAIREGLTSA